jgi:TonB-linked SusC/RagA family outer membrane protein
VIKSIRCFTLQLNQANKSMKFYNKLSSCRPGSLYKFLWIMRLIIILFIAGIMQVSATTYAQNISLHEQHISIKRIFKEIKSQTGYDVLWQPGNLDAGKYITVNFNKAPLTEVISECIAGERLTFEVKDQTVIIKPLAMTKPERWETLRQDSVIYKGTVLDENGKPLPGATVKFRDTKKATFTTSEGNFAIYGPTKAVLIISYLGFVSREFQVNSSDSKRLIKISMSTISTGLGEVNIVSTGYQDLAKERATGSFELITKEQLQHSTDPNLIKRLEGITTSMNFNNNSNTNATNSSRVTNYSPLANLSIRGKNTLQIMNAEDNTSGQVLVVIDGIASPYSIDQVNPNDVESISVLKDAASASIWGSRAANGVIVIKTKRGNYEQPLSISFNSNLNITEKINLFYSKTMSSSDFIDAEILKFNAANTNLPVINLFQPTKMVSPVVEILDQQKKGLITPVQATAQLDLLRINDVRNDLTKYFLRDAVTQSYSLAMTGGTKKINYRLSGGYDKSLNNTLNSGSNRTVINYNVTLRPLKNLELQGGISYNQQNINEQADFGSKIQGLIGGSFYPYTRLADDQGNPLAIQSGFHPGYVALLASTYGDNILDMTYKPLEDINYGYKKNKTQNLNLNLNANYKISPIFSASLIYNANWGLIDVDNVNKQSSYFMRYLTNQYTNRNTFERSIPLGGREVASITKSNNETLRGQLNANKIWGEKHEFSAIGGIDIAQSYNILKAFENYGYDDKSLTFVNNINHASPVPNLWNDPFVGQPNSPLPSSYSNIQDARLRTVSLYSNAAYTYDKRYTISASVRKDESSAFGEGANRRGTPFYSLGASWIINNESFYCFSPLPYLRLRVTYGYNGNVNPAASAVPLIYYTPKQDVSNGNLLGYASTQGVTNSNLRPERTGILNVGVDFGVKNNRLSGSVEYYHKKTSDLLASNPVDPSTGYSIATINTGTLTGNGIDLTLNSLNLHIEKFRWNSNFLFSYNRVKLTKLYSQIVPTGGLLAIDPLVYTTGYDLTRIFAYKWAGLDPNTGDPRGFLNGKVVTISSNNAGAELYNDIYYAPVSSVRYFGSAVPVYYGSFRNTFSYGNFSLSANILYKLGYWFRRPITSLVNYTLFYTDNTIMGAEYEQRWQKPGDELRTNVPSAVYGNYTARDQFYQNSEVNVLKADHIRLQEINLSYTLNKSNWFIKSPRIYANITNLGIIWRANKAGLDPDVFDIPQPRTYSLGLSANF